MLSAPSPMIMRIARAQRRERMLAQLRQMGVVVVAAIVGSAITVGVMLLAGVL